MTDQSLVDVTIAAPFETVWTALTDRDQLMRWFGWDTESLEAEVDFIFIKGTTPDKAAGVVQFGEWDGNTDRYEVIDKGDHTVVRMVRSGAPPDGGWHGTFDDVVQGWTAFTQQLKFAIERQGLAARRTLYLSGQPMTDGGPLGASALGLTTLPSPGTAYSSEQGPEPLTGQVWHTPQHQTGVTVDAVGNGLLIVMDRPANDKWPRGGSQVILSTYGLSDADFAALEGRWKAWWDQRFQPRDAAAECETA